MVLRLSKGFLCFHFDEYLLEKVVSKEATFPTRNESFYKESLPCLLVPKSTFFSSTMKYFLHICLISMGSAKASFSSQFTLSRSVVHPFHDIFFSEISIGSGIRAWVLHQSQLETFGFHVGNHDQHVSRERICPGKRGSLEFFFKI